MAQWKGKMIEGGVTALALPVATTMNAAGWRNFVAETARPVIKTPLPPYSRLDQLFPELADLQVAHLLAILVFFLTWWAVREAVFFLFFSRKKVTAYRAAILVVCGGILAVDLALFMFAVRKMTGFTRSGEITTPVVLAGLSYCMIQVVLGFFSARLRREDTDEEVDPVSDAERAAIRAHAADAERAAARVQSAAGSNESNGHSPRPERVVQ